MSPITIGFIGIGVLVFAFVIGMPIAFSMALVGMAGFAYLVSPTVGMSLLPRAIYEQISSYPLTVITMFVMMGTYTFAAGIGRRLFDTAYKILGHLPGGLTVATIAASTLFGAICGSTAATCATIGKTAIPEMKRYKYSDTLATGTVAVAGGLGIMIPPSTTFIVYGIMTEQSIGKLFVSGIIPGIIIALLFMTTVYIICKRNPKAGPPGPSTTLKEKVFSLKGLIGTIILFVAILGGLFAGWFSPTQAGAMGCVGALLIGLVTRELTRKNVKDATFEGLRLSCMIILLIAGASVFGLFITRTTMPYVLADWVSAQALPPIVVMILIIAFYFILGLAIDAMALIVLLTPILFPLILELGYDPIWFGVMVTLISMTAVITPPEGVNLFVVKGIARDVPLETIFKGVMPFLIPFAVATVLLVAFPQLATFLPRFITY